VACQSGDNNPRERFTALLGAIVLGHVAGLPRQPRAWADWAKKRLSLRLRDWLPPIEEFTRGSGPTTLLKLDGDRIEPQICSHSLFPKFTQALTDLGA
jgi:hypothetical protein